MKRGRGLHFCNDDSLLVAHKVRNIYIFMDGIEVSEWFYDGDDQCLNMINK